VVTVFRGNPVTAMRPAGGVDMAGETGGCGSVPDRVASGGGVWIFGGVPGGVFATGSVGCGGFLSFLPNEKKAI